MQHITTNITNQEEKLEEHLIKLYLTPLESDHLYYIQQKQTLITPEIKKNAIDNAKLMQSIRKDVPDILNMKLIVNPQYATTILAQYLHRKDDMPYCETKLQNLISINHDNSTEFNSSKLHGDTVAYAKFANEKYSKLEQEFNKKNEDFINLHFLIFL